MNEQLVSKLNKIAVGIYKLLGFGLLALILVGLLSYLSVQGFFLVNHRWLAPTIVSPTDERILQLNTRIAEQAAARDRLIADRNDLKARLDDAERTVVAQTAFQAHFEAALQGDREARWREVSRLMSLSRDYDAAGAEIAESNKAYSGLA